MIEPQVPTSQHPGDQVLTAKPLGALYGQAVIIFIFIFLNREIITSFLASLKYSFEVIY